MPGLKGIGSRNGCWKQSLVDNSDPQLFSPTTSAANSSDMSVWSIVMMILNATASWQSLVGMVYAQARWTRFGVSICTKSWSFCCWHHCDTVVSIWRSSYACSKRWESKHLQNICIMSLPASISKLSVMSLPRYFTTAATMLPSSRYSVRAKCEWFSQRGHSQYYETLKSRFQQCYIQILTACNMWQKPSINVEASVEA